MSEDQPRKIVSLAEIAAGGQAAQDMFGPQVDLDPELQRYLETSEAAGMTMLRHPLVYSVPHFAALNGRMNEMLAHKRAVVEKSKATRQWSRVLAMHERPYRVSAFDEIEQQMTDDEYWKTLGWLWTDSENINQNFDLWHSLWQSTRPGREKAMNDDERAAFAALPDKLTIWRGVGDKDSISGMSWTLDHDMAVWFAHRYSQKGRTPLLAEAVLDKEEAFALFLGRNEHEIVADPDAVAITKAGPAPAARPRR